MKRLRFCITAIALAAAYATTSFTPHPTKVVTQGWFQYIEVLAQVPPDQEPENPNSYMYLGPENGPNCIPGNSRVCAVYATLDESNWGHPTQESLDYVKYLSNNFTTEVPGVITFQDYPF